MGYGYTLEWDGDTWNVVNCYGDIVFSSLWEDEAQDMLDDLEEW